MHLWISFNGWAARVTDVEKDADMIKELAKCPRLNGAFSDLFDQSDEYKETVRRFSSFWPIFSLNFPLSGYASH